MNKILRKIGCMCLVAILVISNTDLVNVEAKSISTSYCKKKKSIVFKDSRGFKKVVINGKNKKIRKGVTKLTLTFSKVGTYKVKLINKNGKVRWKRVIFDKTAPSIEGAVNGENYNGEVTLCAKDAHGIKSFSVNGNKVKSPFAVTVKGAGECRAIAKDKAGNTTKISFTVNQPVISTASPSAVSSSAVTTNTQNEVSKPSPTPRVGVINGITIADGEATEAVGDVPDKIPDVVCNHNWVLSTRVLEPTCHSEGSDKYVCSHCQGTKLEPITKVEHSYTKVVEDSKCCVKKNTCTEDGLYYKVCEYCGAISNETSVVPATGHSFNKKVATPTYLKESATEEHGDIYYYVCSNCGASGTETWDNGRKLSHTVHNFTDTSVVSEANKAKDATCEDSAKYYCKCTGCDSFSVTDTFSVGDPLGHDMQKTLISEANCEHGNKYMSKCGRCGHVEGEAVDDGNMITHDFSKNIPNDEYLIHKASCSEPAEYYSSCSHCGKSAKDIEPTKTFKVGVALAHDYTGMTIDEKYLCNEATCQHGTEYYNCCKNCGQSSELGDKSTFFNGSAIKHDYSNCSKKDLKESTTCQHGNIYYKCCKWCDLSARGEAGGKHLYVNKNVGVIYTWDDGKLERHAWEKSVLPDGSNLAFPATETGITLWRPYCKWCGVLNPDNEEVFSE